MWQERVNNFVTNKSNSNIPIVLISSGGTKVSIEKNEVRTLENFSTGFRGAKSAEYFLESGYRCIFLYRKGHNNYFPYTFTLKTQLSLEIDGEFLLSFGASCLLLSTIHIHSGPNDSEGGGGVVATQHKARQ